MIGGLRRRAAMVGEGSGPAPSVALLIVGPDEVYGDIRAGQYFILDVNNMKQVVGTQEEVVDNYKEYLGPISWSISSGGTIASIDSGSNTEGSVSISDSGSFSISAEVNGGTISKNVSGTYKMTDYLISSFADLEELQRVINNKTETTITLTKVSSSTYTPTDGNGLSGAHIRLTSDINCGGSNLHIGYCYNNSSIGNANNRYFSGIFDGAGYTITNIGGAVSTHSYASTPVFSFLFELVYQARIFNLAVEGTVTKPTSTSNTGCFGWANGCTIERLYTHIVSDTYYNGTNTQTIRTVAVSANNTFKDILTDDNLVSGMTNAFGGWLTNCTVNRLGTVSTISTYNTGKYSNNGFFVPYTNTTVADTFAIVRANGAVSDWYTSETFGCSYGIGVNGTSSYSAENCYAVRDGGRIDTVWAMRRGSQTNKCTRCYYDSYKHGVLASDEAAVGKTTAQMKSGELFPANNTNWIQKEGFYPVLNNQFAVKACVLAAIRK